MNSTWFLKIKTVNDPQATLINFPCGGGSAASFWSWQSIPLNVDIWALKLPGRDNRILDPLIHSSQELLAHIVEVWPEQFATPLVFYGHSMGAGIAFELLLELMKVKKPLPQLLIAAGREAPDCEYNYQVNHLSDDELLEYIQNLGGLDQSLPKDNDFLKHYIPKMRADYELTASIPCRREIKLPLPIAIINGKDDPFVRMENLAKWENFTSGFFKSEYLAGKHFFMLDHFDLFIQKISEYVSVL